MHAMHARKGSQSASGAAGTGDGVAVVQVPGRPQYAAARVFWWRGVGVKGAAVAAALHVHVGGHPWLCRIDVRWQVQARTGAV